MEIKTSNIKTIKFANPWTGKEGDALYFHEIVLENGDAGKIGACTEARPSWLTQGAPFTYKNVNGKFYRTERPAERHSESSDSRSEGRSDRSSGKGSFNKFARLEDTPEYWLKRQKCISMTTCLDRANRLVETGKIELKDKYTEALKDYNFILQYSGIDNPVSPLTGTPNPPSESIQVREVRKSPASQQPALFEPAPTQVPQYIQESINNCSSPAQLTSLKNQLKEHELTPDVLNAIKIRKGQFKNKK